MNGAPPKPVVAAPPKSPELVHAEAELGRLRDALLRLTWERDHLKQVYEQVAALGDAELATARDLARGVLSLITEN